MRRIHVPITKKLYAATEGGSKQKNIKNPLLLITMQEWNPCLPFIWRYGYSALSVLLLFEECFEIFFIELIFLVAEFAYDLGMAVVDKALEVRWFQADKGTADVLLRSGS